MAQRTPDTPPLRQADLLADDGMESLSGTLERIVFHNEENGYTVFRLRPHGTRAADGDFGVITVVGCMPDAQAGVSLKVSGRWVENPRFGRQFQLQSFESTLPSTIEGIRLYLASGLIRGVGPALAERIVDRFGADTLAILDNSPEKLLEISGVGKKSLTRITEAWQEHTGIRDFMFFLQPHGISAAYALRIYKAYGQQSLAIVQENPYRLAMDIHGIGFVTADMLARKLGFEKDSPLRAQAGLLFTLRRLTDDGHVFYPREELIPLAGRDLDIDEGLIEDALAVLEREERIVQEELENGVTGIYQSRFHHYESKIAYYLQRVLRSPKSVSFTAPEQTVDEVVSRLGIALAPEQLEAVKTATRSKVMVLTGGPGTGKTTIINVIIKVFETVKTKILLAAPTGRAAKRMSETSGHDARTIHRLLEFSPRDEGFQRNENNPLACGLLVVDEASMMDTMLMYHLLKAVPLGATVIFVGDVNQLPSVGPGNVLRDIIASRVIPVVELVEIFRQAAESEIICNAHRINKGEMPDCESSKERLSDFYFIRQSDPELVAQRVVDLVCNHIPRRFKLDPVNDVQVLTPMHKGAVGSANLNAMLQQALNHQHKALQRGERRYVLDDKVMQLRNNYEKDVFNGDIGRICLVDTEERCLTVRFDDRNIPYTIEELDELAPAYAISVHKSQGSEYPAVVIPLLTQHYIMLQRNLVYTAITRGKKLVVLVGESKALAMAIHNNKMQKRYTWLAQRLAGS